MSCASCALISPSTRPACRILIPCCLEGGKKETGDGKLTLASAYQALAARSIELLRSRHDGSEVEEAAWLDGEKVQHWFDALKKELRRIKRALCRSGLPPPTDDAIHAEMLKGTKTFLKGTRSRGSAFSDPDIVARIRELVTRYGRTHTPHLLGQSKDPLDRERNEGSGNGADEVDIGNVADVPGAAGDAAAASADSATLAAAGRAADPVSPRLAPPRAASDRADAPRPKRRRTQSSDGSSHGRDGADTGRRSNATPFSPPTERSASPTVRIDWKAFYMAKEEARREVSRPATFDPVVQPAFYLWNQVFHIVTWATKVERSLRSTSYPPDSSTLPPPPPPYSVKDLAIDSDALAAVRIRGEDLKKRLHKALRNEALACVAVSVAQRKEVDDSFPVDDLFGDIESFLDEEE